jgi:hypothetical protein
LIEAKHFKEDFWPLVRRGTARFFRGEPRGLLAAAKRCGLRIVLLVDALNECPPALQPSLLTGAQAFAFQYDCRIVFTAQSAVELTGDLAATKKPLPLPSPAQKRAIYAYHARVEPSKGLDYLCSAFTNAYDLTIAGRCHGGASPPSSRADLYDRYVHHCLE